MALVIDRQDLWGNTRVVFGKHTLPAAHVAGGDPSDPGFQTIEKVEIDQGVSDLLYEYDYTNKKIVTKYPMGGASGGTNDGTGTTTTGATAITGTAADLAAINSGAAREVEVGKVLSAVVLRVIFYGQ